MKIKLFKNRYKQIGKYKIDRLIFNIAFFLIMGFLFFVAQHYNFNLDYYKCGMPPGELCKNPFYKPTTWKNTEYLPRGEYGRPPGLLFNSLYYVSFGLLGLAFVINHFIYNKGKIKLNLPTE